MAELIKITNPTSGEEQYPITSPDAVIDSNGKSLTEELSSIETKVEDIDITLNGSYRNYIPDSAINTTTGAVGEHDGTEVSREYISVRYGDSIEWRYEQAGTYSVLVYYDSNHVRLGYYTSSDASGVRRFVIDSTKAINVAYIRIGYYSSAINPYVKINGEVVYKRHENIEGIVPSAQTVAEIATLTLDSVIFPSLPKVEYAYLLASGKWTVGADRYGRLIPVNSGELWAIKANSFHDCYYAFLVDDNVSSGGIANIVSNTDRTVVSVNESKIFMIPEGCNYLNVPANYNNEDRSPSRLCKVYGYGNDIVHINNREQSLNILSQLNRPRGNNQIKQAVFLHFSDIHGSSQELLRIKRYYDEYQSFIGDVIHTGDTVVQNIGSDMSFWSQYGDERFLNCIGNHDATESGDTSGSGVGATAQECYTKFMAPYITSWNVESSGEVCYYYKDYIASRLRLIVIDEFHWDNTQELWLEQTLSEAAVEDYHVMMATHSVNGAITQLENCTFISSTNGQGLHSDISARQIVQDFIDAGGTLVCWLCGHSHYDNCGYSLDYPDQLRIVVSCANATSAANYDVDRTRGAKQQDCFNVVAIDTLYGLLRVYRVGADYDRYMRHKGTMCIDYINKTLISNN